MRGLRGRVVVITGGGGGIGAATARRLAEEGAAVAVLDIDAEAAGRAAHAFVASGGAARPFACDLAVHAAAAGAVAAAEAALGPADVLINNAGWDVFRPFLQTTPDEWQRLIAINLTG